MSFIRKFGFLSAFLLPIITIAGWYSGAWWNYHTAIFVFVFITLIDYFVGTDSKNVEPESVQNLSEDQYYRLVTYAWFFVQVGFVIWGCYAVSQPHALGPFEWFGFVVGFSLVTGGIGITVAHELGHKKSGIERFFSKGILMTVCYMHFYIEHNRGHHVTVATPDDPATARKGETFYHFWYRSVVHGYLHAWKLERERLHRQNKSMWHPDNAMIYYTLLPLVFCALLTTAISIIQNRFCYEVALFFIAQSIGAFTLLELVNYIEHYGIVRKRLATGAYERVNPLHSWNASHLISNFFLFQLQRHSDHHANAIKRYQVLNHYDESPQLPFGYPTMILMALIPPLWFHKMDPLLEDWKVRVYMPSVAA